MNAETSSSPTPNQSRLRPTTPSLLLLAAVFVFSGCAHIKPYSAVEILPNQENVILTPAPGGLVAYDEPTAQQWDRTYNHCMQVENAIAKEIDSRASRLSRRRNWILGIGGLAGLANALYSSLAEEPKDDVLVPLGMVSGASLFTFMPSLGEDERKEELKNRLSRLNYLHTQAEAALLEVDQLLLDKALLEKNSDNETNPQKKALIDKEIDEKIRELDQGISVLKTKLVSWTTATRPLGSDE